MKSKCVDFKTHLTSFSYSNFCWLYFPILVYCLHWVVFYSLSLIYLDHKWKIVQNECATVSREQQWTHSEFGSMDWDKNRESATFVFGKCFPENIMTEPDDIWKENLFIVRKIMKQQSLSYDMLKKSTIKKTDQKMAIFPFNITKANTKQNYEQTKPKHTCMLAIGHVYLRMHKCACVYLDRIEIVFYVFFFSLHMQYRINFIRCYTFFILFQYSRLFFRILGWVTIILNFLKATKAVAV